MDAKSFIDWPTMNRGEVDLGAACDSTQAKQSKLATKNETEKQFMKVFLN